MHAFSTVILTRELDDNRELARRLSGMGLNVVEYPCIETCLLPFESSMLPRGRSMEDFDAVVFTSRRGVLAVAPEVVASAGRARLAAVGNATATAIRERFRRKPDVTSQVQTAEGLAEELLAILKSGARVLLFRGDRSVGTLQETLRSKGMEVLEVEVYRNVTPHMVPLEDHLPRPQFAGPVVAVLSSPSVAERFFEVNPGLVDCALVAAFGPTTLARVRQLGCQRARCAPSPDTESVTQCVVELLSEGAS